MNEKMYNNIIARKAEYMNNAIEKLIARFEEVKKMSNPEYKAYHALDAVFCDELKEIAKLSQQITIFHTELQEKSKKEL